MLHEFNLHVEVHEQIVDEVLAVELESCADLVFVIQQCMCPGSVEM